MNPAHKAKLKSASLKVNVGRNHLADAQPQLEHEDDDVDYRWDEEITIWANLEGIAGIRSEPIPPSSTGELVVPEGWLGLPLVTPPSALAHLGEALACYSTALALLEVVEADTQNEQRCIGQGQEVCKSMLQHIKRLIADFDFNKNEEAEGNQ